MMIYRVFKAIGTQEYSGEYRMRDTWLADFINYDDAIKYTKDVDITPPEPMPWQGMNRTKVAVTVWYCNDARQDAGSGLFSREQHGKLWNEPDYKPEDYYWEFEGPVDDIQCTLGDPETYIPVDYVESRGGLCGE